MSSIDSALGISPQALALRAQRMSLLSANIANADTPGYKARDIDFQSALQAAEASQGSLAHNSSPHARHIPLSGASSNQPDVLYRQPTQLTMDGNTVDPSKEHAAFMENAIRYQASLQLLDSRIKGIRNAIKGE